MGAIILPAHKAIVMVAAYGLVLAATLAVLAPEIGGEVARATAAETPDNKLWQAVAPGTLTSTSLMRPMTGVAILISPDRGSTRPLGPEPVKIRLIDCHSAGDAEIGKAAFYQIPKGAVRRPWCPN